MINNDREYRITKASAEKFRRAIDDFDELAALESGLDPLIVKAQVESLQSQYDELVELLHEYEALKAGNTREFSTNSIADIGKLLIRARVASGLPKRSYRTDFL